MSEYIFSFCDKYVLWFCDKYILWLGFCDLDKYLSIWTNRVGHLSGRDSIGSLGLLCLKPLRHFLSHILGFPSSPSPACYSIISRLNCQSGPWYLNIKGVHLYVEKFLTQYYEKRNVCISWLNYVPWRRLLLCCIFVRLKCKA